MYVKNIVIENNGPIQKLELLEKDIFQENGNPKPILLIGKNGQGKTVLISQIFDAIYELHGSIFSDISGGENSKKYYKILGSINKRVRASYSFNYIQFDIDGDKLEYIEKVGDLTFEECKQKTGDMLTLSSGWINDENIKVSTTAFGKERKKDFRNNSYIFFPINRGEAPHWLNSDFNTGDEYHDIGRRFSSYLYKDLVCTSSLSKNKMWLLDVVMDSSLNTGVGTEEILWGNINEILSKIIGKDNVRFGIGNRIRGASRVGIMEYKNDESGNETSSWELIPTIDHLSSGQSTLLNLFLSIIRYSDKMNYVLDEINGIVLIDEIDAHLHIDLQREVLPELISMFPKIQFIITSHSPFFLLGMKQKKEAIAGDFDFSLVKMPEGELLEVKDLHSFEEINKSYDIFEKNFKDFSTEINLLQEKIVDNNKTLIITEGKTDWMHIKNSIDQLSFELDIDFLEYGDEIEMGDDALLQMCRSFSKVLHQRKIIFIFDRDKDSVLNKVETDGKYKEWGNNVYSFAIPEISIRDFKELSIEHYYSDEDLKKEINGRRLFLGMEFHKNGNSKCGKFQTIHKNKCGINKVIDDKVYVSTDIEHINSLALSKADYTRGILDGAEEFSGISFENFKSILNIIKDINDLSS